MANARLTWRNITNWRPGALAWAGIELTGWFFLRAAAQALAILFLAKVLGTTDYGAFVAVLAISGISASIAGLGLPSVVLRDGARQPAELRVLLGRALCVWWRSVLVFSLATLLLAKMVLPPIAAPWFAIAGMIFAEIVSVSLVELLGRAFQAQQKTRVYGVMQAGLPLARLLALAAIWVSSHNDLENWLHAYTAASLGYMAVVSWLTYRHIGWKPSAQRMWAMIREGIPFTAGGVSARVQAEYNKPLLAQVAFAHAGNFNIAQRAVDLVSLPILALQEALWPKLYADTDHRRRLLIAGIVLILMSVIGAVAVIAIANLIPTILGEEFRAASELMVWLALLPLLAVLRALGNFQLIASGRTYLLTRIYLIGGIAGVVFSTILIPSYGLLGAAWACYAAESTALITILILLKSRS
ncbi:MAG: oligosaccharide flippase family protein [Thermomonas sp.]|uniref:polysaccharide biosynthesis C-terminal domain-containing protein n=1 Tax=Thermomonas sp. TaxID=1971895 RepID=UPI0039E3E763